MTVRRGRPELVLHDRYWRVAVTAGFQHTPLTHALAILDLDRHLALLSPKFVTLPESVVVSILPCTLVRLFFACTSN